MWDLRELTVSRSQLCKEPALMGSFPLWFPAILVNKYCCCCCTLYKQLNISSYGSSFWIKNSLCICLCEYWMRNLQHLQETLEAWPAWRLCRTTARLLRAAVPQTRFACLEDTCLQELLHQQHINKSVTLLLWIRLIFKFSWKYALHWCPRHLTLLVLKNLSKPKCIFNVKQCCVWCSNFCTGVDLISSNSSLFHHHW